MEAEFVIHLKIDGCAAEERAQPIEEVFQHDYPFRFDRRVTQKR